MPASERDEALPRVTAGVSMRELLASCAAARAVSTPPRVPVPATTKPTEPVTVRRPEAA